jgi:hypothetical protein
MGTPSASVNKLRLTPFLARSVGFGPHFFPAQRGLGHGPIHRLPCPIDPFQLVILQQASFPKPPENARLDPLLEAIMGGAAGTNARGIQRVPLAACPQDKEDRVQALPVIRRWTTTPEAVRVHSFGQQRLNLGPQFVRHLV